MGVYLTSSVSLNQGSYACSDKCGLHELELAVDGMAEESHCNDELILDVYTF